MTVSTSGNRTSSAGNGVTTAFAFPYKFFADSDLVVIEKDDVTGVETTKTISTHYTVSGAGNDAGGTVTMLTAPALNTTLSIYRDPSKLQSLDLVEYQALPAEELEKAFDKITLLAQRALEVLTRSVRLSEGHPGGFDPTLPKLLEANKILVLNATGNGFDLGPELGDITTAITVTAQAVVDAQNAASAASNSASSASTQSSNASTYATNAFNSAAAAANSASAAATSASNAATSESNADTAKLAAQAAQTAAENAANSTIWSKVVFLTTANSPRTIVEADKGTLFVVDCTAGNFTFNLDLIANLNLTNPWSVGIKKSDASGNIITINRGGTDLIDGAASTTVSVPAAGVTLVPDNSTTPDSWTSVLFGAGGGSTAPDLTGTLAAPVSISSGSGISFSGTYYNNIKFLKSNGGAVAVGTSPQIQAGNLVGQRLLLVFTDDTDTVELNDGNGLDLAAKFISAAKRKLELEWDGTVWSENFRR